MTQISYISTRGYTAPLNFTDILLAGLAPDGGLFVPGNAWPALDIAALQGKSYVDIAEAVISPFLDTTLTRRELRDILEATYSSATFGSDEIVPLRPLDDATYLMELFHGPTLAFKDIALQFLGRVFDAVLEKSGRTLTIIGATSGDTGSAAIEACRGRKNINIHILHPHNRTSEVQRRQMTTVMDANVHNIAVEGTFDDCQSFVKQAFADADLLALNLSAVNSINWARIIAQTVYYVATIARLGPGVHFAVPTGNFGNVYAAYVARQMGAPLGQLIIGSNRNDILTRFFESGSMKRETVSPSLSPSMDIQVSSNFERYLWELLNHDAGRVLSVMEGFRRDGIYRVSAEEHNRARIEFHAYRCSDDDTLATIREIYDRTGILVDPHTAVGLNAVAQARAQHMIKPDQIAVSLACAHPAKFPDAVQKATGIRPGLPPALADLMARPERFDVVSADYADIKRNILNHQ